MSHTNRSKGYIQNDELSAFISLDDIVLMVIPNLIIKHKQYKEINIANFNTFLYINTKTRNIENYYYKKIPI